MKKFILIASAAALGIASISYAMWEKTAEQVLPLAETNWRLVELSDSVVNTVTEYNPNGAYIIFSAEGGRFSGSTGCNRIVGRYESTEANKISFSQTITTKMFCMNGMEVENKMLSLFDAVVGYAISKDSLTLLNAKNESLARFVAFTPLEAK